MAKRKARATRAPSNSTTWTVRGVSQETRQAVTMAARRAGQKVGLYVDHALRDAATRTLQSAHPSPAPRQEELLEQMLVQMRETNERNAKLEERVGAMEQRPARGWWSRLFGS